MAGQDEILNPPGGFILWFKIKMTGVFFSGEGAFERGMAVYA